MTRNLTGSLEDLDLDEIVRVIAISRRSGMLTVDSLEGKAELGFVGGRLVRARLQDSQETLGSLLMRAGILDDDDIREHGGGSSGTRTLDDVIKELAAERGERALLVRVDDVIAEQLTALALRVMLYRSGQFSFRVADDSSTPLRYLRDTAFTLPAGADADELAREAKRRRREKKSDPLAGMTPGAVRRPSGPADAIELFLVDDDPVFLQAAERAATDAGVHTSTLSSARAAVERFSALSHSDVPAVMVVDLVMPRTTGRGILGGLEVLKRAAEADLAGRVFLAFDDEHDDARTVARALGAAGVVMKPPPSGKSGVPRPARPAAELDEPAYAPYLNPVLEWLRRAPLVAQSYDLAKELRSEFGEVSGEWRTEGGRIVDENVRSLETLKALLGELNDPSFEEEIPLLVLRFASAFFVRGALFSVDDERGELAGLGGFGLGVPDPGRLVHSIKLPLHADTVFSRCVKERAGVRQPFYDSEWNLRLTSALGGPRPREVYTAPLISPRGIEALIYADNATEPRPFPDVQLLEIFLQQSAAAIERHLLSKRVKALELTSSTPRPAEP